MIYFLDIFLRGNFITKIINSEIVYLNNIHARPVMQLRLRLVDNLCASSDNICVNLSVKPAGTGLYSLAIKLVNKFKKLVFSYQHDSQSILDLFWLEQY